MIRIARCFAAFAFALSFASATARAAEGDVQLFNGKDLTGWQVHYKEPGPKIEDVWSVKEGGILHCKGRPIGYIYTDKDYTSYKLKLEWRGVGKPGNSGALLRVTTPPPEKETWPRSIECQLQSKNAGDIWNIGKFPMKVAQDRTKGRHTKKIHETNEKPVETGEWNTYEITLDGPHLELKVNGVVQNRAYDCEVSPGKIALQSEGAQIEFRNIVLTPLPDEGMTAKLAKDAKRLEGLEGWHVLGKGNWTYKDGVIAGSQPESTKTYTHVVSDKSYENFKASLQFKAVKGNSGFYFRVQPSDESRMQGIQAEIDEKKNVGGMYESYGRNWLSLPKPEEVQKFFKPGEWNEMTVEGHGPHIVVSVNGTKASEINDPSIRMKGPFALQIHGGQDVEVMFKDIKIEELP